MRVKTRVVLFTLVGLLLFSVTVAAAPSGAVPGEAARIQPLAGEPFVPPMSGELAGGLVVPAMQNLDGGEQLGAQALVKRVNPFAIAARMRSRTAFHHLDATGAARVAGEELPGVAVAIQATPSHLPAGGRIERYLSGDAARISLPGGKHAMAVSTMPIATRSGAGAYKALNLQLHEVSDGFAVSEAAVPVRIPKTLAAGVQIPSDGVSLTPLGASRAPLSGTGTLDGAAVFYANTQEDTDTAVKATASGFETDSLLRSADSPERLSFRVGMPVGASLVPIDGLGGARVVANGRTLAVIPAPTAQDAEGTVVPVATKVSGTTIHLYLAHRGRGYRYPISVDPTVEDGRFLPPYGTKYTNWRGESGRYIFVPEATREAMHVTIWPHYEANEWAALLYPTQGESHIYALLMETSASGVPENVENHLAIMGSGAWESKSGVWEANDVLPKNYGRTSTEVCVAGGCSSSGGTPGNVAAYWVNATGSYSGVGTPEGISLYAATVYIAQSNGPSASFDTTTSTFGYRKQNALYGTNGWIGGSEGIVELDETDPGVGVSKAAIGVNGGEKRPLPRGEAEGGPVQFSESARTEIGPTYPVHLPDGEPTVEAEVFNAMGSVVKASTKVKVDETAPFGIALSGLPAGNELSDSYRALKVTAKATDGSGSVISSGVASLKLAIDGKEVGSPNGSCSPGPCTATGEWSLGGAENYGAGKHVFTVTATDGAGNVATSETSFTVHHATPTSFGPGTVNPVTGDFDMEESDVSISTPGPALTVTRNYDSREPTGGAGGALGAPWSLSFGGAQELSRNVSTKNMVLTSPSGGLSVFVYLGGGRYESPTGDKNLILGANAGETEFTLTNDGATTTFRHTSGESENVWRPAIAAGLGGTNETQYLYGSVGGVVEPSEELGPIPAGVSCAPTLERGCRALTFSYASSTSASGEAPSEWGEYNGRLVKVSFTAYDPAAKEMTTKAVAQYAYDTKGRLRAVWDPRISPALKRTFGYDPEGHVTAASEAGQEPWIFGYGTASLDTSPGRLVTASRPVASTALGNGIAPAIISAPPSVSIAQPIIGHSIRVYPGAWMYKPLRYGYQWMRCNATGGECTAIGGAINSTYTPVSADVGHTLLVQVTATSAGGSTVVSSVATAVCSRLAGELTEYAAGGAPWAITAGPDGNLWATVTGSGSIDRITTSGGVSTYAGMSGATSPHGITVGGDGNLWFTDYGLGKIGRMSTGGSLLASYPVEANAKDAGIAAGPDGNLWYTSYATSKINRITTAGAYIAYSLPTGSEPVDIATGPDGNLWFTDERTSKIGKITISGVVTEYALPAGSKPIGIAAGPDGNLWFTEFATNKIGKITTSGVVTEYALASGAGPEGIVAGPEGQIWFTEYTASKLGSITTSGTVSSYALPSGSGPKGIAVGPDGYLWIAENGSNKIAKFSPGVAAEGAHLEGPETPLPASATSTIEYGVPVSGTGAPYSLGGSEVAKWGQTDVPVEATAMFPPDEPMSWPATDYKRATVDYLDAADRLVNVAGPGGAIATREYNSYNDVVRTLSPDNREEALKEGSKSAEVSRTLDTQSTFGSEGQEQLSTLGPLHTVKLGSGATVAARAHTVYSYDENAPAGGPYRLVTKVTTGAQIAGEPEADIRTTTKSYAGQNNLGWALREPTATRVDPAGLKLTHTTVYDSTSGDVTETRTPAAGAPGEEILSGYVDRTTFGSAEQLAFPEGMTLDKEGNVWVTSAANDRVEEFSSGGTLIREFGTVGKGLGQFKGPSGITIDGEGHVWVADSGNNRIEEFSSTGTFITDIEPQSTEKQYRLDHPTGIVYSPVNSLLYVADSGNNGIRAFNMKGQAQFKIGPLSGEPGSEPGHFDWPVGVTVDSSGNVWVADTGNDRVQEFTSKGEYLSQFGSPSQPLEEPLGVAMGPEGNVFVADSGLGRVGVYSPSGVLQYRFGSKGSGLQNMSYPSALVFDSSSDVYVLDTGHDRVEKWVPAGGVHESSGTGGTHGEQTIYYTAGANTEAAACGEHPEWGGLPCEKRPAAQPETSGVPNLPVTTITYNLWDAPLTSTETIGSSTRTTTNTYDGAGRLTSSAVTATAGTALPTVSIEYSPGTGLPVKQSTTVEGIVEAIERTFNTLGQQTAYKDADGNTSTTEYDIDGREMATNDGKGTQTLTYDPTTGFLTKLVDSAAGTFTGAYDVEGNLVTAGYPNGMNVVHLYNATDRETGIEYIKTTHCTSGCTWFSQSETPSIHGQTLSQTSTLSSQGYTYDAGGRLTRVQDTPVGAGCTTRVYALEEETNITSLTTRAPGSEGKCATEGGTAVNHSYDSANRLIDTGIAYDAFGDITKLPAGDAGGAELTSTFYADETLASQTQSGETIGYHRDPQGRPRQAIATGKTSSTITMHYADGGTTPAWSEETFGHWTRNIPGLEGGIVATQSSGETPVIQIEDLHGNIVGTASLSETATGLLSKGDSTEYGVPRTSSPPKYSWQGGLGLRTEFPTGIIAMGARSYVPEIGRFLQPDPIEGGSANEYSYTYGDPVNTSDPSGEFTVATPSWVNGFLSEQAEVATEAAIQKAAEEQAAREEAEAAAAEAAQEEESSGAGEAAGTGGGGSHHGHSGRGNRQAMESIALMTEGSGSCSPVKRCAIEKRKEEEQRVRRERKHEKAAEEAEEARNKEIRQAALEAEIEEAKALAQGYIEGMEDGE
ncbi:MAG TPA: SMP-30/gluconolactonase/LRE family protein [Solirubrobacteraceae bacterium]|nr:SMP-30/gluconolactonase/LRE family protein [Solirubrobacteraceae bacterium]